MVNFNDIKYERISYSQTETEIKRLTTELEKTRDYDIFVDICKKIINIQNHIEEMYDYADIRNMRDYDNNFFSDEINYWNEYKPKFDLLFLPFYKIIINSTYRDKLLEVIPSNFFATIMCQLKTTSSETVELQQKESEIKGAYRKLSQNKIMYDGEERTLSYVSKFFIDKDRSVRKKAHDAVNDYYYSKQKKYDKILFDLINTRNKMAKKLGFDSYVDYSLFKLRRFGYNYEDIDKFRTNIINYVVPLCRKMSEWQKEELSLEKLEYFDTIYFDEMPSLKYCGTDLLNEFSKSFEKIDKEIFELFKSMISNDYIDLIQRDGKVNFTITNYLTEMCLPVITGNFKNTYLDVQTTTHEMGHAFQKYCSSIKDKDYIVSPLLKYATMEIAEMFSQAMELISLSYIDNLFSTEDYQKYCFIKIYNFISSLPYICLVDEFQESIYRNNNLKVSDIRKTWLKLAKKYHLEKSNSGHINLKSGGYFYRQSHIYLNPFYYIDYALSTFGAFAIWSESNTDLKLFKEIGEVASYYSFSELIDKYNMPDPFDEETVKNIVEKLDTELTSKRKSLNR